jgi:hypothetical protein
MCERLCAGVAVTYWVRHPSVSPHLFPSARDPFSTTDLPPRSAPRLDLPLGSSSSEFLHVRSCTSSFDVVLTYPGFRPSSRHDRNASTPREASRASLRSAPRLSQPLDGLLRIPARGPVSSHNHVQGSLPFRGFSPHAAFRHSSRRASPSSFHDRPLTNRSPLPRSVASTPRLHST